MCRSTACRPTSSAAPSPTERPAAGGSTATRHLRALFHPRRNRGRSARGQGPRAGLGQGPGRPVLPRNPGIGPRPLRRRHRDAHRLCRAERPRLCRDRAAAARARDPAAGRREHAVDQGLDPRQSRPGPRADAREPVLRLLQGTDRARPARRAQRAGDAARARVAADPNYVPLGAPIYIAQGRPPRDRRACGLRRTSAARSRAPNRFDTFWGAGPEAVAIAGGMSARARR